MGVGDTTEKQLTNMFIVVTLSAWYLLRIIDQFFQIVAKHIAHEIHHANNHI